MKILLICVLLLGGCSISKPENATNQEVSFELVTLEKGVAVIRMTNISRRTLSYEHWFGQKGAPVAYCRNSTLDIRVCSTEVFLLEGEFFTHETYIKPGVFVDFEANVSSCKRVGVKFYSLEDGYSEYYHWFQLDENAYKVSRQGLCFGACNGLK
ncbi:hypothetical protein [Teredinibacter turnerae]|uniref:hypothetical protein n=1 Tax=Teredinibacter turnerae TaxID=2426 RepID=UPI0003742FF4|nr:hypothetical protein [Teredinibacter turnerae]